jgi:hypothetical protein
VYFSSRFGSTFFGAAFGSSSTSGSNAPRGISSSCVALILAFGTQEHEGQGGIRYLMTTSAMEKLFATLGRTQQIARLAGQYAVVSAADSTVITVGHRYQ